MFLFKQWGLDMIDFMMSDKTSDSEVQNEMNNTACALCNSILKHLILGKLRYHITKMI